MNSILSPQKGKMTEQRSKFLSFVFPCKSVEEQTALVKKMRSEYPSATHICYASAIDLGNIQYYSSDDGEPSGTAGVPILNAIKENQLVNVIVFVVRYFGGIKLGTSGLIKAYKESAELCLKEIISVEKKRLFKMSCAYENFDKVKKLAFKNGNKIENETFLDDVTFCIYLRENEEELYLNVVDSLDDLHKFCYVR